jgi:hypothetical protein
MKEIAKELHSVPIPAPPIGAFPRKWIWKFFLRRTDRRFGPASRLKETGTKS